MATLQYVGARYVPVFYKNPDGSWDWESGVSYEPLTIVRYGTGTYISRSQVPSSVGTPNENPNYWAQTGDYNGSIIAIEEELNKINARYQNHIIILGDSYGSQSATRFSWFPSFTQRIRNSYTTYAQPGASFANSGNSYILALNGALASMSSAEKYNCQDIVIGGGYNDFGYKGDGGTYEELVSGMQSFVDAATRALPNLKRIFFGWLGNGTNLNRKNLWKYMSMFARACARCHIEYSPYAAFATHRFDQFVDRHHPNSTLANSMGIEMFNAWKGKNLNYSWISYNLPLNSEVQSSAIDFYLSAGYVIVYNTAISIERESASTDPFTFSFNEDNPLVNMTEKFRCMMFGSVFTTTSMPTSIVMEIQKREVRIYTADRSLSVKSIFIPYLYQQIPMSFC